MKERFAALMISNAFSLFVVFGSSACQTNSYYTVSKGGAKLIFYPLSGAGTAKLIANHSHDCPLSAANPLTCRSDALRNAHAVWSLAHHSSARNRRLATVQIDLFCIGLAFREILKQVPLV